MGLAEQQADANVFFNDLIDKYLIHIYYFARLLILFFIEALNKIRLRNGEKELKVYSFIMPMVFIPLVELLTDLEPSAIFILLEWKGGKIMS